MEFRVGFVANGSGSAVPFGSPDSEIARRVAMRLALMNAEMARASPPPMGASAASASSTSALAGASSSSSAAARSAADAAEAELALPWTARVAKLEEERLSGRASMPAFNDAEKTRMLEALWGPKRDPSTSAAASSSSFSSSFPGPADPALARSIRTFLTHMALSNTITPEVKTSASGDETMQFNFSSPDELALCQFAAAMGFTFVSRSKDGVQLRIDKQGHGDGRTEVELYQQLAVLDFNSKRKRVTCVYYRDGLVHVMCKGADGNVLPLLYNPNVATSGDREPSSAADPTAREALEAQLSDMAAKGLRTLVVAGSTRPADWWWGSDDNPGMSAVYKAINLPDRGSEKGHSKGECRSDCRACAGLLHMERAAHLRLVGLTAVEDRLQELVPEAIADFLQAGIKIWSGAEGSSMPSACSLHPTLAAVICFVMADAAVVLCVCVC